MLTQRVAALEVEQVDTGASAPFFMTIRPLARPRFRTMHIRMRGHTTTPTNPVFSTPSTRTR